LTLAEIGPDAVPALVKALEDKSESVKGGAAAALGAIGPPAKPAGAAPIKIAEDKDSTKRKTATGALGNVGRDAKAAAPALRKALEDKDAAIRLEAARALWRVAADKKAVDALVKSLDDLVTALGQRVFELLGEMGPEAKAATDGLKK